MRGVLGCLLLIIVTSDAGWAQEAGRIEGQVVGARDEAPVAGVNVLLAGTLFAAVTDAEGRFVLEAVPPGSYEVQVNALDYEAASETVTVTEGGTAQVIVELRQEGADLETVQAEAAPPADLTPRTAWTERAWEAGVPIDLGFVVEGTPGFAAARRGPLGPLVLSGPSAVDVVLVDGARIIEADPLETLSPLSRVAPVAAVTLGVTAGPYDLAAGGGEGVARLETLGGDLPNQTLRLVAEGGYRGNGRVALGSLRAQGRRGPLGYDVVTSIERGRDYEDGAGRSVEGGFQAQGIRARIRYQRTEAARWTLTGGARRWTDVDVPGGALRLGEAHAVDATLRYERALAAGIVRGVDVLATAQRYQTDHAGSIASLNAEAGRLGARVATVLPSVQGIAFVAGGEAYRTAYETSGEGTLAQTAPWPQTYQHEAAAFLEALYASGAWEMRAAARVDYVEQGDEDQQAWVTPGMAFSVARSVAARWEVGGGLATSAQPPQLAERFADRLPVGPAAQPVTGASDLDAARSAQADLWVNGEAGRWTVQARGYVRHVQDAVVLRAAPSDPVLPPEVPPFRWANETVRYAGAEARLVYRLRGELAQVRGWGSYVWGTNRDAGAAAYRVPAPAAEAGLYLRAPAGLIELALVARGALRQARVAERLGERPTDGYATADLRTTIRLPRRAALSLGVENVFDVAYAVHASAVQPLTGVRIPEPGRAAYVRLRLAY